METSARGIVVEQRLRRCNGGTAYILCNTRNGVRCEMYYIR